ncbi:hypothetical protein [Spongiactinospora sp. TRM90649]|uniref:hypothetical protein n=1 Tax=Spongiactinospora sp. TRM90649 TaxID=3031114 RepID=UPI0023F76E5B|nr:hypothetical protein [Spongiactinospora sp. TRM90649]MDF5755532.1 hypothetical protein [Spongiactinospora sp. TRM90649]
MRLADGPAKLRQEKSVRVMPSYARLERTAAPTAYLPGVEGLPVAVTGRGQQPTDHDYHFANGGLRGSHPWRDPVKT